MAIESLNQRAIWLRAAALAGVVLFRVNSGKAWVGHGKPQRLTDGSVVLHGARPIALGFGLANGDPVAGQADLVGWRTITITPEMVGCKVAVFTSIEAKRTDGGRISSEQQKWRRAVLLAGGIAGVANSPEAAVDIVNGYRPPSADLFAGSGTGTG